MIDGHPHPPRVAIIGVGNVGATFAYALLLSGLAAEIVLVDVNQAKAQGETMDLITPSLSPTLLASGPATMPIAPGRP